MLHSGDEDVVWPPEQDGRDNGVPTDNYYHGEHDLKPRATPHRPHTVATTYRPDYMYSRSESKRSLCDGRNVSPSSDCISRRETLDGRDFLHRKPSYRESIGYRPKWMQQQRDWKGTHSYEREPSWKRHQSYQREPSWKGQYHSSLGREPSWKGHHYHHTPHHNSPSRPESPPGLVGSETSSVSTHETDYHGSNTKLSDSRARQNPSKTIEVTPGVRMKLRGGKLCRWDRQVSLIPSVPAMQLSRRNLASNLG